MSDFKRIDTTANRIKIALTEAGKKQADLVRETGIDKGALSSYVNGKYEPKQDTIYKLAKALNVSEMWLWGYDCKKERSEMQKKNDALSDIVIRMQTDDMFMSAVETLYKWDKKKLSSILALFD